MAQGMRAPVDRESALASDRHYRHELRLMMNLFQPSVKLLRKERIGSRLKRVYDTPRTPLERLQAYPEADRETIAALIQLRDTTDPFVLSKTIDTKLARIWDLASRPNHSNRVTSQTA